MANRELPCPGPGGRQTAGMFIGHLGVGLALKKAEPRLSLGWLFLAVMLPDVVLWLFVLAGVETVRIPADYATRRYLTFVFPYSHGLVAVIGWAVLAYLAGKMTRGVHAGGVLALGVFSHFVLDWLVHPPELPLAGERTLMVGLGLWDHLPLALLLEMALLAGGAWLYFRATRGGVFGARYGMGVFLGVLAGLAIGGQAFGPPPPSVTQLAGSSLGILVLTCALAAWLDRRRRPSGEGG